MRNKNRSKFYVTGVSGTGKSALVKELQQRGLRAFDIDDIPDLCHWRNKITGDKAKYQSGIGRDWIDAHNWICDRIKLADLIKDDGVVVVAGVASNQDEYLSLFDKIFLLHCREDTFLYRLSTREGNEFAKEKSEQEQVLSWYKEFEEKILKEGAIPIDTEESISSVADKIMSYTVKRK